MLGAVVDDADQSRAGGHRRIPVPVDDARQVLGGDTGDELARIVDTNWDPPVTASARLVSIVDDCAQHLGQAAYLRGIAQ